MPSKLEMYSVFIYADNFKAEGNIESELSKL